MIHSVVSVRDSAAEVFNRPWIVPHRNVAVRDFTDEINRQAPDNPVNKHPDDYDLFYLGTFDDSTGLFKLEDIPAVIVRGKDVFAAS